MRFQHAFGVLIGGFITLDEDVTGPSAAQHEVKPHIARGTGASSMLTSESRVMKLC